MDGGVNRKHRLILLLSNWGVWIAPPSSQVCAPPPPLSIGFSRGKMVRSYFVPRGSGCQYSSSSGFPCPPSSDVAPGSPSSPCACLGAGGRSQALLWLPAHRAEALAFHLSVPSKGWTASVSGSGWMARQGGRWLETRLLSGELPAPQPRPLDHILRCAKTHLVLRPFPRLPMRGQKAPLYLLVSN